MSGSRLRRAIALLPFGYTAATRVRSPRDFAYLVATSWIPAMWMLWRLSGLGWVDSVSTFALGYLAFIAVYELGYFANDVWDAARSTEGRKRLPFPAGFGFALLFGTIRLALWLAIGHWAGWLYDPIWVAGYAALGFAFTLHNLIGDNGLRIATFVELATLRLVLPVLAAVPIDATVVLALAALPYTYIRTLSYMDSKSLLRMPDRGAPRFGFLSLAILAPFAGLLSLAARSSVPIEINLYFMTVYGCWWLAERGRRGRQA